MANDLIRGPAASDTPPAKPSANVHPTWGFAVSDGTPKLFQLKEGEALPEGFADSPAKCGNGKKKRKAVEEDEADGESA